MTYLKVQTANRKLVSAIWLVPTAVVPNLSLHLNLQSRGVSQGLRAASHKFSFSS